MLLDEAGCVEITVYKIGEIFYWLKGAEADACFVRVTITSYTRVDYILSVILLFGECFSFVLMATVQACFY